MGETVWCGVDAGAGADSRGGIACDEVGRVGWGSAGDGRGTSSSGGEAGRGGCLRPLGVGPSRLPQKAVDPPPPDQKKKLIRHADADTRCKLYYVGLGWLLFSLCV